MLGSPPCALSAMDGMRLLQCSAAHHTLQRARPFLPLNVAQLAPCALSGLDSKGLMTGSAAADSCMLDSGSLPTVASAALSPVGLLPAPQFSCWRPLLLAGARACSTGLLGPAVTCSLLARGASVPGLVSGVWALTPGLQTCASWGAGPALDPLACPPISDAAAEKVPASLSAGKLGASAS